MPVRAVWLDTPPEVCLAHNAARTGRARVPLVGVHATRARFVPPSVGEGFDRVDVVRHALPLLPVELGTEAELLRGRVGPPACTGERRTM
ncbi:hypothetical protein [Blastococcus sp. DSM 46786]|uniref:hypothetical protein n=1 Tax=Blastococcus sp. DSM 46786 TaxID=1798227 RepID=UPI001FCD6176|nr:hypothetical protein [Blastococcus sp. DSM 46786]